MKKLKFIKHFSLTIMLAITLTACGGSDGGGSDGGSTSIPYTGTTTQAAIDVSNGKAIAIGANQGGGTGVTFGGFTALTTANVDESVSSSRPNVLIVASSLKDTLEQVDFSSPSENSNIHAVVARSGSLPGPCGGDVPYNVSVNDQTGDFSGTFNFSSFCAYGVSLSGSVTVSGNIISTSPIEFSELNITFNNLATTSGSESFSMQGTMTFNISSGAVTINMTMLNNNTSKVTWINNYTMTITDSGFSYVDIAISGGTFYHPDYGFVSIRTTEPIRIYGGDIYPQSGVLVCTGASGSEVVLTINNTYNYDIDIDLEGDGTPEDTATYSWN